MKKREQLVTMSAHVTLSPIPEDMLTVHDCWEEYPTLWMN